MSAKKVTITGNSASGKSTLSKPLGVKLGLPIFHIDLLLWKPNWDHLPEPEFDIVHHEWLAKSRWLIEGVGYHSAMLQRFATADTIIFVDTSYEVCIERARKRIEEDRVVKNQFIPDDCQYHVVEGRQMEVIRYFQRKHTTTNPKPIAGRICKKTNLYFRWMFRC